MSPQAIFGISVLQGLVVWGMIAARYVWPALRDRPRTDALRPILFFHAFRFVGLAFLVPGVVSPDLPAAFAQPAAYGDLATSILALLAIAMLGSGPGTIIVWVFNIVGTVDLLNAFYQADRLGVGVDTWPAGCRVPHSHRGRATSPRDARPCVPHPARNRCRGRSPGWPTRGVIADFRERQEVQMSGQQVVLITGASSGVGQSTARLLSQKAYKVFGTSRNPASAEAIPDVEVLPLDVPADDSVRACVEAVSSRGGRIDVLINDAGYELAGAVEELTSEETRAQFETNFFGVVRMVNAVLPAMRRQRSGHIINVSSLAGVSSIPFLGMYCASNGRSMPLVLLRRRRLARRWWPKRCSRSCPAMRRSCATGLGNKRSRSLVYGDFSRQECLNKECSILLTG